MNKSRLIVGVLALAVALPVLAQSGASTSEGDSSHAMVQEARPVGEYAGVTPGGEESPPAEARVRRQQAQREKAQSSRRRRRAPKNLLTWPGFQMREDGSSRFFLQTSGRVATTTNRADGRFEVILRNTRIHLRNNARPLETRFFNTPVLRARTERRGDDVAIVFEMRAAATPRVHSEASGTGYHYVYIDFPAGAYVEAPTTVDPVAAQIEAPLPAPEDVEEPVDAPAGDMQPGQVRVVQDDEAPPGR